MPQDETTEEVMALIEGDELYGTGIGYVDAQLLTATLLTPDAQLWTFMLRGRRSGPSVDMRPRV
jgi:hypothetical protein